MSVCMLCWIVVVFIGKHSCNETAGDMCEYLVVHLEPK